MELKETAWGIWNGREEMKNGGVEYFTNVYQERKLKGETEGELRGWKDKLIINKDTPNKKEGEKML